MGLGRSKFPISYEEARARGRRGYVTYVNLCVVAGSDVVKRLRDTFDRYASSGGYLPQVTFTRDIFGDGMPSKLAEVSVADT